MAFTGGYPKCRSCRSPIRVARGAEDLCKNCRPSIAPAAKVREVAPHDHDGAGAAARKSSSRRR